MKDLLEVSDELARKYADTVDHATYKYISETIGWLREAGENPADYELRMVSTREPSDPFTTGWQLSIRKKVTNPRIVD